MAKNGLVKVYFADGVHLIYGYHGGYCWCKGRQCVPSAYGRKRANLLGFLNAATYETERVMDSPYLNSDSVCKGLRKLRAKNPSEIIYVILDNAAYQRCKKVKQEAEQLNINLIFLPPYSPNLNLIERLWKFLRKIVLANKYYPSLAAFVSAIKSFIDTLHLRYKDQLTSLLDFNFEILDSSNLCGS